MYSQPRANLAAIENMYVYSSIIGKAEFPQDLNTYVISVPLTHNEAEMMYL